MKVSAKLFALLLVIQAAPYAIARAYAQPTDAQAAQREDEFDGQRLQMDYRRFYSSGYDMPSYAADEVIETHRKLADGNQISSRETGVRARDENGRVHVSYKSTSGKSRTFIADLKTNTAWLVRPERKDVLRIVGVPPANRIIRSYRAPIKAPDWSREVRKPLGIKEIAGVKAVGYLTEIFYPPGSRGNQKEMVDTREYWNAPEISEIVYTRSFTSAHGERIARLENVKLGDVSEALFAIPADYPVRDVVQDKVPAIEPAESR